MTPTCYIWHCQRMGWLTNTSQYSTDISQARSFGLTEARERATRHNTDGVRLLVVRLDDQVFP